MTNLRRNDAIISSDPVQENAAPDLLTELTNNNKTQKEEFQRLQNERLAIKNSTAKENRTIRKWLMIGLTIVSLCWLSFTGYIVHSLAFCSECRLSDMVASAFITTSLATVLGLWAIGLRYFFAKES
ncbi:MAG: hypothetical protein LBH00_07470 [Planctomycetaceae bacterium]|jgi:uncharacterized membrane protein YukC|nr:hypothetical protein [Planctomycetaceae bacterium]